MKTDLLNKPVVHIFLIIVLCLLVYSNTFYVPFHFDDQHFIVDNPKIKSLSSIPSLFKISKDIYTPMPFSQTTLAINYYLGGLNTLGYHLFNILIHAVNGILLYLVILKTAKLMNYTQENIRVIGIFSSLVFISHPIHTESVTYITGRVMSLMTIFYLLGILLFTKAVSSEKGGPFYIICLFLSSFLGMASRENFVTFPFMLILYDFFFVSRYNIRKVMKNFKIHIPVLSTYVYFAYQMISGYEYQQVNEASKLITPLEYLMTQFNVHWTYLRLLLLPINQRIDYYYPISRTIFEFPTMLSFIGYIGLWASGIYLWRRNTVISFCILWFMITLSPVSSIIPLFNMIFEHRLYLSSIGILVAITIIIFYILRLTIHNSRIFLVSYCLLLIIIITTFSVATFARNNVWKDEVRMWEDVVSNGPTRPGWHTNLGNAYKSKGLIDRAIEQYQIAIKLNPDDSNAYSNLCSTYNSVSLFSKAIEQCKIAIRLNPDYMKAHNNLGNAYKSKGLIDKAIEQYQIAIKLNPDFPKAHYNLGNTYRSKGLIDKAIEQYQIAIKLNRYYLKAYNNLGNAYKSKGLIDKAIEQYQIAIKLNPGIPELHNNLSIAYRAKGLVDKAIEHYETAVRLKKERGIQH